jgi:hypothetical protein
MLKPLQLALPVTEGVVGHVYHTHLITPIYRVRKALLSEFFLLYFQLPYLPEETCFQQAGSSMVEGTSQAVVGSSDQRKVPASLSLFLKSEKIPALLYIGEGPEYMPFCDLRCVP